MVPTAMMLPPVIEEHFEELQALCRLHGVRRLTLFGSAARGTFDPERSDLDFIVEFFRRPNPADEGRAWLDLWKGLKRVFNRPVDLIDVSSIDNLDLEQSIRRSTIDLYEAA